MNFLAPPEVVEERRAVCDGCEHLEEVPIVGPKCAACHCFLIAKTRLANSTCPLGFWPR